MLPSVVRKATERESKWTRQRTEKVENEIDFVSIVHYNYNYNYNYLNLILNNTLLFLIIVDLIILILNRYDEFLKRRVEFII